MANGFSPYRVVGDNIEFDPMDIELGRQHRAASKRAIKRSMMTGLGIEEYGQLQDQMDIPFLREQQRLVSGIESQIKQVEAAQQTIIDGPMGTDQEAALDLYKARLKEAGMNARNLDNNQARYTRAVAVATLRASNGGIAYEPKTEDDIELAARDLMSDLATGDPDDAQKLDQALWDMSAEYSTEDMAAIIDKALVLGKADDPTSTRGVSVKILSELQQEALENEFGMVGVMRQRVGNETALDKAQLAKAQRSGNAASKDMGKYHDAVLANPELYSVYGLGDTGPEFSAALSQAGNLKKGNIDLSKQAVYDFVGASGANSQDRKSWDQLGQLRLDLIRQLSAVQNSTIRPTLAVLDPQIRQTPLYRALPGNHEQKMMTMNKILTQQQYVTNRYVVQPAIREVLETGGLSLEPQIREIVQADLNLSDEQAAQMIPFTQVGQAGQAGAFRRRVTPESPEGPSDAVEDTLAPMPTDTAEEIAQPLPAPSLATPAAQAAGSTGQEQVVETGDGEKVPAKTQASAPAAVDPEGVEYARRLYRGRGSATGESDESPHMPGQPDLAKKKRNSVLNIYGRE